MIQVKALQPAVCFAQFANKREAFMGIGEAAVVWGIVAAMATFATVLFTVTWLTGHGLPRR
jgi:hypothetical protein